MVQNTFPGCTTWPIRCKAIPAPWATVCQDFPSQIPPERVIGEIRGSPTQASQLRYLGVSVWPDCSSEIRSLRAWALPLAADKYLFRKTTWHGSGQRPMWGMWCLWRAWPLGKPCQVSSYLTESLVSEREPAGAKTAVFLISASPENWSRSACLPARVNLI